MMFRSCNTEDEWAHAAGCIASDLSMQERWVRDMSPAVALVTSLQLFILVGGNAQVPIPF